MDVSARDGVAFAVDPCGFSSNMDPHFLLSASECGPGPTVQAAVGATKMSYVALVTALFLHAAASHGDELGQRVDEWGDAVTISPLPHLHRDWAPPLRLLHRDWTRPSHTCTGALSHRALPAALEYPDAYNVR